MANNVHARLATMLLQDVCVFLCIPLFDCKMRTLYAHMLIVVAFLVVKIFTCLIIAS